MQEPGNGLAAELVRSTGRLRLAVVGSSMLPAIRPRDVLLVRRCAPTAARVGDVVLFTRDARLFAHRVVAAGDILVTRGDALAESDAPVQPSELLGRVERVVRHGRVMRPRAPRLGTRLAAKLFRRSARAGRMLARVDAARRRLGW
jgi:signal peptidase I